MTTTTLFRASTARCATVLIATAVFAASASSAFSQTRSNIWAGDSSYSQCKRDRSADFTKCLQTLEIMNPGERYAACDVKWKEGMAICWTNYKMELANRGGNWNPSPNPSSGPLGPISSGPLYPPSTQPLRGNVRSNFAPVTRTESSPSPRLRTSRIYRPSASPSKRSFKTASLPTRGKVSTSKRASYKPSANRSFKVASNNTRFSSSGRRGPHQSGGLIRDPAPTIRR